MTLSAQPPPAERKLRRTRFLDTLSIALLVAWAGWLAYESLAFGPQSYSRKHDTSEQSTPYYLALSDLSQRGLLGFWHPNAAGGVDALANIKTEQPIVESLFRYLPHWSNSGVLLLLQSMVAGLGMFALLRSTANVAHAAAVVGGAAFAFSYNATVELSGFATWHGLFLPGLPIWHLVLRWGARRTPLAGALAAAAAGAVLALGSLAALGGLAVPMVAVSLWVLEPVLTRRHLVLFGVFSGSYLIVEGPTLASLAVLAADSHRSLWPDLQSTIPDQLTYRAGYREAALVLLKENAVLLSCVFIVWLLDEFRSRSLTAVLVACTVLWLEVALYVDIRDRVRWLVPALGTFQFDRFGYYFFPYFAAAGAGLALHRLGEVAGATAPALRFLRPVVTVLAAAAIGWGVLDRSISMNEAREASRQRGDHYSAFFERPELAALKAATTQSAPFRVATFADNNSLSMSNGLAWRYGFESADAYVNLYPLAYHEFWATVIAPTLARRQDLRDYFYQWGNRIYLFSPYAQLATRPVFETKERTFDQVGNLDLLALANVKFILSAEELKDPRLRLWPGSAARPPIVGASASASPLAELRIYENTAWLPRAFVSSTWRVLPAPADVRAAMTTAGVEQLRTTAYLDADSAVGLAPPSSNDPGSASASFVRYEADSIELAVEAGRPSILVVTNSHSRYWTATVNGAPQKVLLVDATFQGVAVPAGASRVVLQYVPPWRVSGYALALGAGVWAILGMLLLRLPVFVIGLPVFVIGRRQLALAITGGVALVLVAIAATRPAAAAAPWFDAKWDLRQAIVVRGHKLTASAADIPVLIERRPDATTFWQRVATDGRDIRFTDDQGRVLPYELERFDPEQRHMSAWVRVPVVPARGDGWIYLYYGNRDAAADERPQDVWNDGYRAVWHLDQSRTTSPLRVHDSTRYGLSGDLGATPPITTGGRVAGGLWFNGIDTKILVDGAESWEFGLSPWTLEFWIRSAELKKRNFGLFERGDPGQFSFMVHNLDFLYFERQQGTRYSVGHWPYAALPANSWTHVTVRRDGRLISVALNGEFAPASEGPADFADLQLPGPLRIGASSFGKFEGALDEIRVSVGRQRTAEWLRSSYWAQIGEFVRFDREERRDAVSASARNSVP